MLTYKQFVSEALENRIAEKRDPAVTKTDRYDSPTGFMKNAKKVGEVGGLEIHSSETPGGGMAHFTWSPKDKMIHHILYAAEAKKDGDKTRLKFLSAHARKTSPVRMGDVYKSLVVDHNRELVGTSHSPGARKMWERLHRDPDLQIHGVHPNGDVKRLEPGDTMHVPYGATSPEDKKIARMHLVLSKK